MVANNKKYLGKSYQNYWISHAHKNFTGRGVLVCVPHKRIYKND